VDVRVAVELPGDNGGANEVHGTTASSRVVAAGSIASRFYREGRLEGGGGCRVSRSIPMA
jgi:hypothetical protein